MRPFALFSNYKRKFFATQQSRLQLELCCDVEHGDVLMG